MIIFTFISFSYLSFFPNFFLLPTRGWELAIGAGVAFYFIYRKNVMNTLLSHKALGELMSLLGLAMIFYAVFAFDKNTPFPSLYALLPTIGTALVIIFSTKAKNAIGMPKILLNS